jgi:hypothetical protein
MGLVGEAHAGPLLLLRLPPAGAGSPVALLDSWVGALHAEAPSGRCDLLAVCAGGSLGVALARRLAGDLDVRLVITDGLVPGLRRRLRALLRPWRSPWGDDLRARLAAHLRALRLGAGSRVSYLRARWRSLRSGRRRARQPPVRHLVARQVEYERLAAACPPEGWNGDALLVMTPDRLSSAVESHWRRLLPRLQVRALGRPPIPELRRALREFLAP